jgi:hypothetical protein
VQQKKRSNDEPAPNTTTNESVKVDAKTTSESLPDAAAIKPNDSQSKANLFEVISSFSSA